MADTLALIRMPDPAVAPGCRESLGVRARFSVQDFGAGIVGVAPAEGPGADASYFDVVKVADAATNLAAPETWAVLDKHPPRRRHDVDAQAYSEAMLARGKEIRERNPSVESEMVAFALAAFGAAAGTFLSLDSLISPPVSAFFLTSPFVIVRFFNFFPAMVLFSMFFPLMLTTAYELPPSATNSAISDTTLANLKWCWSQESMGTSTWE
jgi:hypothetical protein